MRAKSRLLVVCCYSHYSSFSCQSSQNIPGMTSTSVNNYQTIWLAKRHQTHETGENKLESKLRETGAESKVDSESEESKAAVSERWISSFFAELEIPGPYKSNAAPQGSGKEGRGSCLVVSFGGSETSGCSRSAKDGYYGDNTEQTRLSITHGTRRAVPSGVCYSRTLGYIIPLIFF